MAFNEYEISNQDGAPIILYLFVYGNTFWRYCSAVEDKIVGLDENGNPAKWLATAISDEGVVQGGSDQADVRISVPANLPVAGLLSGGQISGKIWLYVRKYHLGDPQTEMPLQFLGTVANAARDNEATAILTVRSITGSYDRNGLRLFWGRMCPHPLYGPGCFVNPDDHQYPRVIGTIVGNTFSCVSHTDPEEGSFSGGYMEWTRPDGSTERRGIDRQDGNSFTISGGSGHGVVEGLAVRLYPGCPHDTTGCKAFDNLPNYGGFPHLPGKSLFDGTPVF